jgi:hypothetical protein
VTRVAGLVLSLFVAGALPADAAPTCAVGLEPRTQVELYFGRNIGEVLGVSEEAWAKFLDEEVTPRFPEGLSVIDIKGQWKDTGSGRIAREPGKILVLIVAVDDAIRARIAEIIALYKARHRQQSVLTTERDVCVAF